MDKNEARQLNEVYDIARRQADKEIAKLKGEIEAIREESQAFGVLKKIEYDISHNQMLKYMVLSRIKQAKEYRKGGLTWAQFCEAIGESVRTADQILKEIRPLVSQFSAKFADFSGVDFSKIRMLGRAISADSAEITEDGMVIIGDETIPLAPDHRDELQAALERVFEAQQELLREKDANLRTKDRLIQDKQKLIERQAKDLARYEDEAHKKGLTPTEDAFLHKMDTLRTGFDGYMLRIDPERCTEMCARDADAPTPRMISAYLTTLDYMRKQLLAAYDTAQDMYGSAIMTPEEAWTQPEE